MAALRKRGQAQIAASRQQNHHILERLMIMRSPRRQRMEKPEYTEAARNAADFILANLRKKDGRCIAHGVTAKRDRGLF